MRLEGAEAAFAVAFFASTALVVFFTSTALVAFFAGVAATAWFFFAGASAFGTGFFADLATVGFETLSAFSLGAFSPAGCVFYNAEVRLHTDGKGRKANLVDNRLVLGGELDLSRRSLGENEHAVFLTGGDGPVQMRCVCSVVLEVEVVFLADVLHHVV